MVVFIMFFSVFGHHEDFLKILEDDLATSDFYLVYSVVSNPYIKLLWLETQGS